MGIPISWYPGHMARARRNIEAAIRQVDAVIEVVDPRLPASARNPELQELLARRPKLIVGSKADLADPETTQAWLAHWESEGQAAVAVHLEAPDARNILQQQLDRFAVRRPGRKGLRWLIVGIPNVGKSTLINCLARGAKAVYGSQTRRYAGNTVDSHRRRTLSSRLSWSVMAKTRPAGTGLNLAWIGCIGGIAFDPETVGAFPS